MVKQGKFAQVNQMKRQKNVARRQLDHNSKTIMNDKIAEFLTVRYHLMNQKQPVWVIQETMLRFLNILIDQFGTQTIWNLEDGLEQSFKTIGNQVPWQFYYILSLQKTNFMKFLKREVPAVPLKDRLIMVNVSLQTFDEIVTQHLALNWFAAQYRNQPEKLQQLQAAHISDLQKSFLNEEGVAWKSVEVLYLNQAIASDKSSLDSQTRKWIAALKQIEINL